MNPIHGSDLHFEVSVVDVLLEASCVLDSIPFSLESIDSPQYLRDITQCLIQTWKVVGRVGTLVPFIQKPFEGLFLRLCA